jgi:hypothetical protein
LPTEINGFIKSDIATYGIFFLITFEIAKDNFFPNIDCAMPETENFRYGEK